MTVYQNSAYNMGTRFNLLLPGINGPDGDGLFSATVKELNRIERMLSCFMPTSDVSYLNANAFNKPILIRNELFDILTDCLKYSTLTQGAFDISLGKIIDHWNGTEKNGNIEKLTAGSGADKIIVDPTNKTVHFTTPHVKINLGGYGKGYALQKVQDLLKANGVTTAFISFGESSVSCMGKHPFGEYWSVGIQDFYQKDKSIAAFKLVDQSVSTSGNMEVNNHIIHPRKGKPVDEKMMISVKSRSALEVEVLSTALMVADSRLPDWIKNTFPEVEIVKVSYNNKKAEISIK